jgi:hypothetical protein
MRVARLDGELQSGRGLAQIADLLASLRRRVSAEVDRVAASS